MPEETLPALMFVAGAAILIWLLIRRSYRRTGRRSVQRDSRPIATQPRPTQEWSGVHTDSAAVLERQKVELAEFARDAHGQIDTKVRVLRELVAQSERQIERMERLLAELNDLADRIPPEDPSAKK